MYEKFQYHLKQLIKIKVRSIIITILVMIGSSILTYFLFKTNYQILVISIYSLLLLICILLFIHHGTILLYFLDIKYHSQKNREKTIHLFEKQLGEAKALQKHLFLRHLANHFIHAYSAYQSILQDTEEHSTKE